MVSSPKIRSTPDVLPLQSHTFWVNLPTTGEQCGSEEEKLGGTTQHESDFFPSACLHEDTAEEMHQTLLFIAH